MNFQNRYTEQEYQEVNPEAAEAEDSDQLGVYDTSLFGRYY
jgi:hypothetical protein